MPSTIKGLDLLAPEELEGGYRRLCGALLVAAATSMNESARRQMRMWGRDSYYEEVIKQREVARGWVDGGTGTITFEEACNAIDWEPCRMRAEMAKHCGPGKRTRKTVSRRRGEP